MPHEKSVHIVGHVAFIVLYGVLIVSAFCALFHDATDKTLFCAGGAALAFGFAFLLCSSISRRRGSKGGKSDAKDSEETLVESGVYSLVRHPEFLGHISIIFALILLSQNWISLIIGVALITLLCFAMIEEEKKNIEKFGSAYKEYMKRVPRINLLAGIVKQMRKGSRKE